MLLDARRAEFLVVDDLELVGAAQGLKLLDGLLIARLDGVRPTVVTGNLDPKKLRETYGMHLADRMRTLCQAVVLAGESMRGKQ